MGIKCWRCKSLRHGCQPLEPSCWAAFNRTVIAREELAERLPLPGDAVQTPPARLVEDFRQADHALRNRVADAQTTRNRTDGDVVTPRKRTRGAAQGLAAGGDFGTSAHDVQRIRTSMESMVRLYAAVSILSACSAFWLRLLIASAAPGQ
jgi:hypothetical protein